MPQLPLLIPMIVTGVLVGSIITHEGRAMSKKRLAGTALLSGLLNGVQAYLVNLLSPQPGATFIRSGVSVTVPATLPVTVPATLRQGSEVTFVISSVVAGILIPLTIVGIAMLYSRYRRGGEEEVEVEEESTAEK